MGKKNPSIWGARKGKEIERDGWMGKRGEMVVMDPGPGKSNEMSTD